MNPIIDHGNYGEYTASNGMTWRLEKVTCSVEEFSRGCGADLWAAVLPAEYPYRPPLNMSDNMSVAHRANGWMFIRRVDAADPFLTRTIEDCIEAYTAELERLRREGNPDSNLVLVPPPGMVIAVDKAEGGDHSMRIERPA